MSQRLVSLYGIVIGLIFFSQQAFAEQSYGWIEKIKVQPWGVEAKAKLDTGALTSSMHAEDIDFFERDGKDWVEFTVEFEDTDTEEVVEKRIERPLLRDFIAKGAGGRDRRPVVLMQVCIADTLYEEQFSLRDRDNMIYPILLGRRTIQHLGPVDVTRTFLTEADCNENSPVKKFDPSDSDEDIGID